MQRPHLYCAITAFIGFLFSSFIVFAAPPQTLDYQGYLANGSGVPLTGSVNISVSLYSAPVGGVAVWTQASSPTLTNGRFAIVLDGSGGRAASLTSNCMLLNSRY